MKFKGQDYEMWDAWYLPDNDGVHVFHLKSQQTPWNVGHLYTKDLLHFEKREDVLQPLNEKEYPDDCLGKFTGCAYYDEKNKQYLLYYTMRNKNLSEKIGLATSKDCNNFEVYKNNPIIVPDESVFGIKYKPEEKVDCRDLIVVKDEKYNKFYGFFATMANIEQRGYIGVIARVESEDLYNWSNQKIVFIPDFDGVIEVPDVFCLEGKWYLTFLTGSMYGGFCNTNEDYLRLYTMYATSNNLNGVFRSKEDNILIGGPEYSGFTCRSYLFKGKRYVNYIDRSMDGFAISLPKELKVINGKLCACYSDILKNICLNSRKINFNDLVPVYNSIAWKTFGGKKIENEGIMITSSPKSCQEFDMAVETPSSAEINFDLKILKGCFGFKFRSNRGDYTLLFNLKERSILLGKNGRYFDLINKRSFNFNKNKNYSIKIILQEGNIEVYVEDILILQGGVFTDSDMRFGFGIYDGKAKIDNIIIKELEK